jgi:dGTPase
MRKHAAGHLFEGNAQSFRVVTFIEPKELGPRGTSERWFGLNLTRASLKAVSKYPWTETDSRASGTPPKFSVYDDPADLEYFRWVWGDAVPEKTLAAQTMDVADDIAYATHDFEDGVWSGMIPLPDLVTADESAVVALRAKLSEKDRHASITDAQVAQGLLDLFHDAFKEGHFRLDERAWAQRPFERTRENVAYLKRLSAALIGKFIDAVTRDEKFTLPDASTRLQIDLLTGIAWVWMIGRTDLRTRQFGQRRIIRQLFDGYMSHPEMLPRQRELSDLHAEDLPEAVFELNLARLVCDHLAGMTDQYALKAHQEMHEGKSPFEIRYIY